MKPSSRLAAVLTALLVVLAACAPAAAPVAQPAPPPPAPPAARPTATPVPPTPTPQQPRQGGVLNVATIANPASFDSVQFPDINVTSLISPAYNRLVRFDPETGTKITPDLAEKWETSADGLTYTFTIRKGVTFHDGAPFTPEDARFDMDLIVHPPKGITSTLAPMLNEQTESISLNGDKLALKLKYPYGPTLALLTHGSAVMYSKATWQAKGDMKTTVNGTGPFKFKGYTPGISFDLVRNDSYYIKGRPYLDGLSFKVLADRATFLAALRTGQVQRSGRFYGALSPSEVETLKKGGAQMDFVSSPTGLGLVVSMNQTRKPFDDVRVRRAFMMGVDKVAAQKVVGEGAANLEPWFPIPGWGYSEVELKQLPGWRQPHDADLAAAKKLLADAGYPNGFDLVVLSRTNQVTKDAATFFTGQMQQMGIRATVELSEDANFWPRMREKRYEASAFTPSAAVPDPIWFGRFLAPKAAFNFSGNDADPRLNELWNAQLKTVDEAKRKAIVRELSNHLLNESIPYVPLGWPQRFIGVASQVRGFTPGVSDYANDTLEVVWLAQ